MWDKAFLFIMITALTYLLYNYKKVFKIILFNLPFTTLYVAASLLIFTWPFPVLKGRSVENGKTWANIMKHITLLFGVKWELRNGEVLAKDCGAVIVSNHQSGLDGSGICNIWNTIDKLTIVMKKEILYVWPMGLIGYFSGAIYIDRNKPKIAYQQLQVITDVMVKNKIKIWVFPEGTRNYDYTKFLPFKKGAFTMAVSAQTPIIPVIFSPYYFIDRKNYKFSKSRVIIQCLEEVPTTGLTMDDVPELTERVRNMMLAAYKKLSDEVLPNTNKHTHKHMKESDVL